MLVTELQPKHVPRAAGCSSRDSKSDLKTFTGIEKSLPSPLAPLPLQTDREQRSTIRARALRAAALLKIEPETSQRPPPRISSLNQIENDSGAKKPNPICVTFSLPLGTWGLSGRSSREAAARSQRCLFNPAPRRDAVIWLIKTSPSARCVQGRCMGM